MSSQKRLIVFLLLSISLMLGIQVLMDRLGLFPPAPKAPPAPIVAAARKPEAAANKTDGPALVAKDESAKTKTIATLGTSKTVDPPFAKAEELRIGSVEERDPKAYHLLATFDQRGAGVLQLSSALFDGETAEGLPDRKNRLHLIRENLNGVPNAFSITLRTVADVNAPSVEIPLDLRVWELVRDKPDAPAVRAVSKKNAAGGTIEGQEIAFRTTVDDLGLTVTKRFRIWKAEDGLEFDLVFDGKGKESKIAYRIFGPHGIPIEGEWYTATFRDIFFAQINGERTTVITKTAADVIKAKDNPDPVQSLPIKYAGVENQYFAVFLEPWPLPTSIEDRKDKEAMAFIAREDVKNSQKSDVGIELTSLPITIGPNLGVTHSYRVFAGPKTAAALEPYKAEDLAGYRKAQLIPIPGAGELAKYVIAPLLERIYALTAQVSRMFGGKTGNYGIAIILLTMTVRLIMFPLGRKQAMIAKKMQDLQPQLMLIKEKFKDDKEAQTRETLAFYKRTGFNPAAGCLPALIQMPIFFGLWQALNNTVELRQSSFLYIRNLAAPDMMFRFPMSIPFLGDYFNLLPFIVVGLMLVQTKLFSPPALTDESKMQQKMMKYMMIFMAFMFYRVPSGLGLYYIVSSSWQICERLLLPKLAAKKTDLADLQLDAPLTSEVLNAAGRPINGDGQGSWLTRKLEKLLEDANNQRTIRNNPNGNGNGSSEPPRSPDRPRSNRPKPPGGSRR